jgi:ethylmalonyl-CoA mutase
VLEAGGSIEAIEYMKEQLVAAHARRQRAVEAGEQKVVGVNDYTESEPSPLLETFDASDSAFLKVDPVAEGAEVERLEIWRRERDGAAAGRALGALKKAAVGGENLVPYSIEAVKAGVTTGEWADALREAFGEYRAPTGVSDRAAAGASASEALAQARERVAAAAAEIGAKRLRLLVAKPGLDGHSNAAEQVAVRARDLGFEVVYQGIRLTPEQIARTAVDEDVHAIGISILSGAHNLLVPELLDRLREEGVDPEKVPVIVGGVIPDDDAEKLTGLGVARVFTPKDYDLTRSVSEIAELIVEARKNGR